MVKKKPGAAHTASGKTAAEAEAGTASPGQESVQAEGAEPRAGGATGAGMAAEGAAEERTAGAQGAFVEGDEARVLEQEAAQWKDRCLRTAAEFENFKKRSVKERSETWSRAQADVIRRTLDVVDDLGRVAALDPAQTTAQALHEGMGLVERKLLKALESVGVERLDPTGQPFDPNLHEAVMTLAAPSAEADHTVGSVLQPGYRLNGMLLRPARVAVFAWTESAAGGSAGTTQ
jgi:molecular chaperone GrpE